jgi:hypothetical protein
MWLSWIRLRLFVDRFETSAPNVAETIIAINAVLKACLTAIESLPTEPGRQIT